jgi:hypothetical protein
MDLYQQHHSGIVQIIQFLDSNNLASLKYGEIRFAELAFL